MNISPRRRRRIIEAHKLRQHGYSIRDIAEHLEVSPATAHADLKLLESQWSDVTGQAADDFLLEHLDKLRERLSALLQHDPLDIFHKFIVSAGDGLYRTWDDQLSPSDLVRIHQARAAEVTALFREVRRTISDIHRRGIQRRIDSADSPILYDNEELADPPIFYPGLDLDQHPQQPLEPDQSWHLNTLNTLNATEPDRIELNDPEHPEHASAHPEQEIVAALAARKICAEQPERPALTADAAEHSYANAAG